MKLSKPRLSAICAFCLALSFLLSSCSFGLKTTNDDIVFSQFFNGAATEYGYFMNSFNDDNYMFYDYETKQLVPICNKPDCKHDDPEVCASYITKDGHGGESWFIPYGEYIYYFVSESFSEMSIIRTNLDNSGRITIANDGFSFINDLVAVDNKIYYRGWLNIYSEDGEDIIGAIQSIHCLDLATNKVSVLLNQEADSNKSIVFEGASRDYIYYFETLYGDSTETWVDDFNGEEHEVPERLEVNLKKLSLSTLEETVIYDMHDCVFDYHDMNAAHFVIKKGESEFEVLELDYRTGKLTTLFTTDMKIAYMVSDKDRLMYDIRDEENFHHRDCMIFDKRTKTSKEVHFKEEGYLYFSSCAEQGDYFIGDIVYEDRQLRAMIKKDDLFDGNLKYDLIQNNGF